MDHHHHLRRRADLVEPERAVRAGRRKPKLLLEEGIGNEARNGTPGAGLDQTHLRAPDRIPVRVLEDAGQRDAVIVAHGDARLGRAGTVGKYRLLMMSSPSQSSS